MKYLYGDATESPLDRNYLEFLREFLDFAVAVLTSDDLITTYERRALARERTAAAQMRQLDVVAKKLKAALEELKSADNMPATDKCIAGIRAASGGELKRHESAVKSGLVAEISEIKGAIARERAANVTRLEKLMLKEDLPESAYAVKARLRGDAYQVEYAGKASTGVEWVMSLGVPEGHLLSTPVRVDDLAAGLTIKVPELSGWISKSEKLKTHKVFKEYVTEIAHGGGKTILKLRDEVSESSTGYDVEIAAKERAMVVTRISKGEASDPFEPIPEDVESLGRIHNQLYEAVNDLRGSHRRSLREAKLDGKPLQEHTEPSVLVKRLIALMAPVVQDIEKHSLSPNELVLKRVLTDDRREEIFCSKSDLTDKLQGLPAPLKEVFAPLGLVDATPEPFFPVPGSARRGAKKQSAAPSGPGASSAPSGPSASSAPSGSGPSSAVPSGPPSAIPAAVPVPSAVPIPSAVPSGPPSSPASGPGSGPASGPPSPTSSAPAVSTTSSSAPRMPEQTEIIHHDELVDEESEEESTILTEYLSDPPPAAKPKSGSGIPKPSAPPKKSVRPKVTPDPKISTKTSTPPAAPDLPSPFSATPSSPPPIKTLPKPHVPPARPPRNTMHGPPPLRHRGKPDVHVIADPESVEVELEESDER